MNSDWCLWSLFMMEFAIGQTDRGMTSQLLILVVAGIGESDIDTGLDW